MNKPLLLILIGLISFASCTSNKGESFEVLQSKIIQIKSPETAISDHEVKIKVKFSGINGCSEPYNLKADKVGQTITLRAFYKQPDTEICTEILPVFELDYNFFADLPGTYFFVSEMDPSIADTLIVY